MRPVALAIVLLACAACGDDAASDDVGPDGGVEGPALIVPAVIALPYVEAGGGAVTIDVTVGNPGTADVHAAWQLTGAGFAIVDAPALIVAGGEAILSLRWDGAAVETIAGATLEVDSDAGGRAAEVWAVAGDPALDAASFASVTGAGGLTIGDSAVVPMPTAPYPTAGGAWTDDRVHVFVPADHRERASQDVVVHFHGHSTTIDATVTAHRYREQVYASGADVVLVVPQGPVNAASGDFGKLADPAGTAAFLDEVLIVLYRAGVITRPVLGDVTLTSHSGGYQAVALNLDAPPFLVPQVNLFDSLYGFLPTYRDYVLGGGVLRSDYTSSGGTDSNNLALASQLETAGTTVATAPTQRALRDPAPLIFATAATHAGATRDDAAYAEQLRWTSRHGRRGPRVELRAAAASGGTATIAWLAPPDDDVTGWRVETSSDRAAWTLAVATAPDATRASFALSAGARVRVVPVVDGVDDPQPSDVGRVDPGADVLVVDAFDRVIEGSWGGLAHDFAADLAEAAGGAHTVSNEAVTEDGFDLTAYRVVIWLLGDESSDDHTFTAAERAAVDAYLDGGGRIIISGSEVGYDQAAQAGGPAFLTRVAGAVYAADDAGTTTAQGAGPLAAITAFAFGDAGAPYLEEYPDTLGAGAGAAVLLAYSTGGAAAVGLAGTGALVGFPLEVIDDPDVLAAVIAGLLAFVGP